LIRLVCDHPVDAMLTKSTAKVGHFMWKPLIRDGGAKLGREVQLYDMTQLLDRRALQYRPAELDNYIPIPSQRQVNWVSTTISPMACQLAIWLTASRISL